jgi:hypothetical protein
MFERKDHITKYLKDKKSKTWLKKFNIKFQDATCLRCDEATQENTEHIFLCKSNHEIWTETKTKMIEALFMITGVSVTSLPYWFGNDQTNYWKETHATNRIENYSKQWGSRGLIPRAIRTYLIRDLKISNRKQEEIIEKWSKILTKTTFKIWTARCNHLEEWATKRIEETEN